MPVYQWHDWRSVSGCRVAPWSGFAASPAVDAGGCSGSLRSEPLLTQILYMSPVILCRKWVHSLGSTEIRGSSPLYCLNPCGSCRDV